MSPDQLEIETAVGPVHETPVGSDSQVPGAEALTQQLGSLAGVGGRGAPFQTSAQVFVAPV